MSAYDPRKDDAVEYQLIKLVDGVEVYRKTSQLPEVIEQSVSDAEKAGEDD